MVYIEIFRTFSIYNRAKLKLTIFQQQLVEPVIRSAFSLLLVLDGRRQRMFLSYLI